MNTDKTRINAREFRESFLSFPCSFRTTIRHFLLALRRFSRHQLCSAGLAGGEQRVDYFPSVRAELVPMRFRYLVDQPMGAQQAQLPSDRCRAAPLFGLIAGRLRVQQGTQVVVAKAVDGELAAVDRLQQL